MNKQYKVKAVCLSILVVLMAATGCKKEDATVKRIPVITWENPADIYSGTLLSSTQLNAFADIPGTFSYSPGVGTRLNTGYNQQLKVVFTPADISTCENAEKTVLINILPDGVSHALFNPALVYGTMTDTDGTSYKTIVIGTHTWMAENLRTVRFRNGDSIPEVASNTEWKSLSTAAYCNYENTTNRDDIATTGRLYNWFAVSDSRNLAPEGWHVATDADWLELTTFLGNEDFAGGKLKETTMLHWFNPNTGATNQSGFTALPGGRREYTDGSFINKGTDGFWWTGSAYNPDYSWYRYLHFDVTDCYRANFHKQYGFSVRCVKD
ncbi:MAG: fibrobacter succinogenes major paralogous domain-containing protein [Bacteroidales bacterium]|nr:fibrobacter succinogenes major paralogous domain-containing protein [Bacteroidales bacterium]